MFETHVQAKYPSVTMASLMTTAVAIPEACQRGASRKASVILARPATRTTAKTPFSWPNGNKSCTPSTLLTAMSTGKGDRIAITAAEGVYFGPRKTLTIKGAPINSKTDKTRLPLPVNASIFLAQRSVCTLDSRASLLNRGYTA